MKIHYALLLSCCLCLCGYFGSAQLYTDAGVSRTICRGDSVILGGTDTAASATAPFSYHWQPATGLNATDVPQPVARPAVTTTYYITSSDANGVVSVDSVTLTVKFSDTYITASDTLVCPGQQVQLTAHVSSPFCGATATCTDNTVTPSVGSGTLVQPGSFLQPPTLFGNFLKSSRSQMLYTRAELQAALGGPAVIKALTFSNGVFNSNAFLQNFTIKMGCAFQDSLTTWNDNLFTVYSVGNYTPQPGWLNGIVLQTPYYWDGNSDLLIDICNYNPTTFGNQNNKAECTQTPFKSYLNSMGTTNQCGGGTTPTAYYLRPNVKFSYCLSDSAPVPILGSNYQWDTDSGLYLLYPNTYTPTIRADSAGYCYFTAQENSCIYRDSVFIDVHNTVSASIVLNNNFCPESGAGSIVVIPKGYTVAVTYWLSTINSTDTVFSGQAISGDSIYLADLSVGQYTLHFTDSVCGDVSYNFTLSGYPSVNQITTSDIQPDDCNGGATGGFCLTVSGGAAPYIYIWDSLITTGNCNYGLSAGKHAVRIVDVTGCTVAADTIEVEPDSDRITGIVAYNYLVDACDNVANGGFCISVNGGTPPYSYVWDTVETQTECYFNFTAGTHYVEVIDSNGCKSAFRPFNVLSETNASPVVTVLDFVHCYGEATGSACVSLSTGTSPYIYLWDSLYTGTICNDTLRAGMHFVIVRDAFGCEGKSNTFTIYQPGGPLTVNSSIDSNTLYLTVTFGTIPYKVNWGDGTVTTMTTSGTRQHTYANDGVYEVVVSDMYGCEYTMTVTILGTGIVRADDGESFVVHPNPAQSVLYLSATNTAITNVSLYDAMGRYLTVSRLPTDHALDISGLVSGVYVVVIETSTGRLARRFVKE